MVQQEKKSTETMQAEPEAQLVEGFGVLRRMDTLREIALQIDSARSREEILDVVRSEAKWLLEYQVCLVGLLNRAQTHYVINTLSSVADATELDHKHFSIDEGMLGWVVRNHTPVAEDIESGPSFSEALEGKLQE